MSKVGFYTKFKIKTENVSEFVNILSEAAKSVSNVKGCVLYIVNKDMQNENYIWVTEIWDTKEDHANSLKLPECVTLISKAMPMLDGRPEQIQLEVIAGI